MIHALALTPSGLHALLAFLETSFHGSTDLDRPLREALMQMQTAVWEHADLLLVSDGLVPSLSAALSAVLAENQQRLGLRIAGLLVGQETSPVMEALCQPCKRLAAWG